jgi:hypothetical protein
MALLLFCEVGFNRYLSTVFNLPFTMHHLGLSNVTIRA